MKFKEYKIGSENRLGWLGTEKNVLPMSIFIQIPYSISLELDKIPETDQKRNLNSEKHCT
jgi:hypothetical protein